MNRNEIEGANENNNNANKGMNGEQQQKIHNGKS